MAENVTHRLASGLNGTTTNGEPTNVIAYSTGQAALSVTAVAGTSPTLDLIIQHSADGTVWFDHTTFTQATGATTEYKAMANFMEFVRAKQTIGGSATPTLTYTVDITFKV